MKCSKHSCLFVFKCLSVYLLVLAKTFSVISAFHIIMLALYTLHVHVWLSQRYMQNHIALIMCLSNTFKFTVWNPSRLVDMLHSYTWWQFLFRSTGWLFQMWQGLFYSVTRHEEVVRIRRHSTHSSFYSPFTKGTKEGKLSWKWEALGDSELTKRQGECLI